jgi:(2Fe-2S) ferredoxin
MSPEEQLQAAAAKHGIGQYRRHVFLCTGPKCCTPEVGMEAWEALKQQLKDANVGNACYRTKVGCLRICCQGPTMVVYPEGTWYHGMTADHMPRLVKEHVIEGKPIAEWIFAKNPLDGCANGSPASAESPSCPSCQGADMSDGLP